MSDRPDLFRPLDPEHNQPTADRETLDALLVAVDECTSLITAQSTATEHAAGRHLEALQPSLDAISDLAAQIEASERNEAERRAELANTVREMTAAEQATSRRLEALQPSLDAVSAFAARLAATPDRDDPDLAEKRPDDTRTLELLEAGMKALQTIQPAVDKLAGAVEASLAETSRLRHALDQANSPGSDLQALDGWRDDFTRHVTALLARAEKEGGIPAAEANASQATALARVDRVTARMALLEDEVGKAAAKMVEAFEAVATALEKHGESIRRTEKSSLMTRKAADLLGMQFDASRKEYRRLRLFRVSPLVLFLAIVAGMLLESHAFIIYKLFR